MSAKPSYSADQRRVADELSRVLVTFDFERKFCDPPQGRATYDGPLPADLAAQVEAVVSLVWAEKMRRDQGESS